MNDIKCDECGLTAYPALNMNSNCAIVPCCPACGREHRNVGVDDFTETPAPVVPDRQPAKVVPIRQEKPVTHPYSDPSPVPSALEAPDPIALIEQRIAWLSDQLSKQAEYAAERRRLLKMLKAAGQ